LFLVIVLSQEEQPSKAYLLNVQAYKDVLKRFREKHSSGIVRAWLLQLPEEEILVQHEEEEEYDEGKAVYDGRNDGICDSWYNAS
jgi:hypothetical protein